MVPQLTDLREEIFKEFHCSRFAVHLGGTKIYSDLRHQYYRSGMKSHVGDIVDDEHCVSSADRWLVREDHTDFRGHAVSMRPGS